jgi:glycerophosphoryl diester phosphodiesterase
LFEMWLIPIISGTYVITSVLFIKHPKLLPSFITNRPNWSVKRKRPVNIHISHRGGCGESYENTLQAFQNAVDLGTQMLELDVHITKDDVVVVSHDQNLKRTTGRDAMIKQTDFIDLPPYQHEIPIDFIAGKTFSSDDKSINYVQIPKLEAVFETFPHVGVNVDIKTYDERLIEEVNKLVAKYQRANETVWGNFSDKTTKKCHETNPEIGLLFPVGQVFKLLFLFYSGLLPYVTLDGTHLEIPMPSMFLKKLGPDATLQHKIIFNLADFLLMRRTLFEHLNQRGIQTYLWVLNSEEEFERAFKDLNVTGVMTDYPTLLKDYLQRHPEYVKKSE